MLSLPCDCVNDIESPPGKSFLSRCLALLCALHDAEDVFRKEYRLYRGRQESEEDRRRRLKNDFYDGHMPGEDLEDILHRSFAGATIRLISDRLRVETVEHTFALPSETVKNDLFQLVAQNIGGRYHPGRLSIGLGSDLMVALINKGLPRWCWSGFNLLLHVLEGVRVTGDCEEPLGIYSTCFALNKRICLL